MNKNQDELSDEKLDRELKKVQLQREKMLLEKEIAQRQRSARAEEMLSSSGHFLLIVVSKFLVRLLRLIQFCARHFLRIIFVAVFLFCSVFGFIAFEESRANEFIKDRRSYVDKACNAPPISCEQFEHYSQLGKCLKKKEQQTSCYESTYDDFTEKNKPFLIFSHVGYY